MIYTNDPLTNTQPITTGKLFVLISCACPTLSLLDYSIFVYNGGSKLKEEP